MGATLVILTGGFDLSAGAVISLVNVALALGLAGGASASPLALTAAASPLAWRRARSTVSSSPRCCSPSW